MALALHAMKALAPHLKGARVLSLGYPDILATADEVQSIFGVAPTAFIKAGEQHGIKRPLVETMELMRLLGTTLDCVDVYNWRGFERICDLNEQQDLGEYDLVIDPGTTEHCFNVGTAIMNGARAVRVGGRIYHSPPLLMMNHGFYNLCPTALQDFYTQNGWQIELYEARSIKTDAARSLNADEAMSRNAKVAQETGLVFMARRMTDAALRWPIQRKYILMQERKAA